MFRDEIHLLKSEAKRFPHIKALFDKGMHLTDDDIETANVRMKWVRKALYAHRKKEIFKYQVANTNVEHTIDDFFGMMGELELLAPTYIGSIEAKDGDKVFLPDSGGLWLDTMFVEHPEPVVTRNVSYISFREYRLKCIKWG